MDPAKVAVQAFMSKLTSDRTLMNDPNVGGFLMMLSQALSSGGLDAGKLAPLLDRLSQVWAEAKEAA